MGILSNSESNTAQVDATDMALLDAVDHETVSNESVLKKNNLAALSKVNQNSDESRAVIAPKTPAETSAPKGLQKESAQAPTPTVTQNNGDHKIDQALSTARRGMIKKVQEMIGDAGEAGKSASLFEMASKLIEAIIRMIQMLLQRLGLAHKQRKSEGEQSNRDSKQVEQKEGAKQATVTAKPAESPVQRSANQQTDVAEPVEKAAASQEAETVEQTAEISAEVSEVDRRLAQAEALINSITGKVGEMLGKFLSDPFVQVHAERGDKSATISALCDRALEACRQDISSVSALVRELTADISGTDAQRFGMRPREVAQLILDGGLDPALVNPKLKSKATLLLREYGPLSDRLSTIRQAVGIIVSDTVSQAVEEGVSSSAVLNETLLSLKSKLITLGGGDDQAMTRLGLDEAFKDVGVSIQAVTESGSQQPLEVALETPASASVELQPGIDQHAGEISSQKAEETASQENPAIASESAGETQPEENTDPHYLEAANDGDYIEAVETDRSDHDRPRA